MKPRRPTLCQAWLLACLLLLAQGLGLAHRVGHAPGLASAWTQDHEAGTPDCRLVDQLAHADALCDGAVVVVVPTPGATPAGPLPVPQPTAAAPAAYLARAPPRG